ncbi:DUF309 domain-containing protein [Kitasatospora sp. NPDC048540]|uniref:DUF309 domain-containing protein n=1 Tax=unclassified Kitasatospora TaxID=2633591 RepID=UPI0006903DC6|nr:DUF309 domain-containing protein [Kitasatospora sp. MBT63]
MSETPPEAGDPACLLNRVCDRCGRLRAAPDAVCTGCGAPPATTAGPVPRPPGARPGRDRDAAGRARNGRPRDGLGRPLPYGQQGVMRQPEGVIRSAERTLAEAQRLIDAGRPFHAHEVLEDRWKSAPDPERPLWRALAQFAVGLTHAARGNEAGARALFSRAAEGLTPFAADPPYGTDLAALAHWARHQSAAADVLTLPPVPPLVPPGC